MSYPRTDDNLGCAVIVLPVIGLLFGVVILGWIAGVVSEVTSVERGTVVAWEIGVAGMVVAVWLTFKMPLLRFSVIVTGTAIGLIVLLLCLTGGNEQILDSVVAKTAVAVVSAGIGAIYMYWEIRRNPDEWS